MFLRLCTSAVILFPTSTLNIPKNETTEPEAPRAVQKCQASFRQIHLLQHCFEPGFIV